MNQQLPTPADLPFERVPFEGETEGFDPSRVSPRTLHTGDLSSSPTASADVRGALLKFGGELPDSAEALIGPRPVDTPTQPADLVTAIDKAGRVLPPTDRASSLPPRRGNTLRKARNILLAGSVAVGLAMLLPAPSTPESAQQQVDQGVSKATLAQIARERAALGLPPMHLIGTSSPNTSSDSK
jgi:hypothetical protein